jgi:hypothetical protein
MTLDAVLAYATAVTEEAVLADDAIVSKIAGGMAALDRGIGPAELITRALRQQRGHEVRQQPGDDAAEFVRSTASALRDACGLNYRP